MDPKKNWPGLEIKHTLERSGFSQTDIARECNVSIVQVHRVIFEGSVSNPVRSCIAQKIGIDKQEIWPEYYLRDSMAA